MSFKVVTEYNFSLHTFLNTQTKRYYETLFQKLNGRDILNSIKSLVKQSGLSSWQTLRWLGVTTSRVNKEFAGRSVDEGRGKIVRLHISRDRVFEDNVMSPDRY